jgi:hypothetical protein
MLLADKKFYQYGLCKQYKVCYVLYADNRMTKALGSPIFHPWGGKEKPALPKAQSHQGVCMITQQKPAGVRKMAVWGLAIFALVFGLVFAGCENAAGPQEVTGSVTINNPRVGAPSVTATPTSDGRYLILTWNAVPNATEEYTVYTQMEGKTTVHRMGTASNDYTYDNTNGSQSSNSDVDKYAYRIPLISSSGDYFGNYKFGVQANPSEALTAGAYASEVAWTGYYQMRSGGKPTSLSTSASYNTTLDRLDEVIAYCTSYPTATNTQAKNRAQTLRTTITDVGSSTWSSVSSTYIPTINTMISSLD